MFKLFKKTDDICKLFAPVNGKTIALENVPDKVFASKMMGDGMGFEYEGNTIYAPCDGKITLVANTLHAVGITSENGAEILIHIGLDTVSLNGKGFKKLINQGDKVKKGTPLIEIDRQFMKEQDINLITPMVVTNAANYEINVIDEGKDVTTEEEVISCKKQ
ncbi:PTS sugar transporter subunit IIA [Holdemanella biformis]